MDSSLETYYYEVMSFTTLRRLRRIFLPALLLRMLILGCVAGELPRRDSTNDVRFEFLPMNGEGPVNTVLCILQDGHGYLWLGTVNGLRRYDGYFFIAHRWTAEAGNSLANDSVISLCEDRYENLWIASSGGGLNRLDEASGVMTRIADDARDSNSSIRTMCADRFGTLWCGTPGGLKRLDRASSTLMRCDESPLGRQEIVSMAEDPAGRIWIGTREHGLARLERERASVSYYRRDAEDKSGLSSDRVTGICIGRRGELWVSTPDEGVFSYDPARDRFAASGSTGSGGAVIEDLSGNLWVGSPDGLTRLNPANGETAHFRRRQDDKNSPRGNHILALYEDRSGLLWVSSTAGGVDRVYQPESGASAAFIPPVTISDFMTFDNSNRNFVMGREVFDSIEISYKVNFFALGFAALDYRAWQKNRYSFMLEGYDKDWTDIRENHFARFTNVPPGSYLFRVKAAGKDGIWNERGTSLRLVITPPFWKTPWFYGLAVLSLVGFIFSLNRYRVQNQLRRITELDRVRAAENRLVRQRASDDFHDEFGHKLTKIALLSQVMKRTAAEGQRVQIEQLDKIIQTSEELSVGMRDFLWALNPEKDSAGDIAIRLKDFGDDLFNGLGIAFRAHGTENGIESIPLSVDWRRHLLLIFKEAMNNAAKHSACRNSTLEFLHEKGILTVRLTDDGRGFDLHTAVAGQGLEGMKKRAEKIRGTLSIVSAGGRGTVVEFAGRIPLNPVRESADPGGKP
jgi:signal transduction histidine kinase/streptogramin lyase